MKPVIAIPQMNDGPCRAYMKSKYSLSLKAAGAVVRWIPLEDVDTAVSLACACDGLILAGGADVSPALYGQEPIPACGEPNPLRDAAEPAIFRAFLATGKPILGICRGAQMLNVCCGGTLHQDLTPIQQLNHSDFANRGRTVHPVTLTPNTRLARIFGGETLPVNSLHHQAVDQIGEGLVAAAVSPDGFVEALELPSHPFCLAVQWHPEHLASHNATQRLLIQAFVEACKK